MAGKRGRERQRLREVVQEAVLNRMKRRANKGLTGEAADNFRAYLSILREWEAKEKQRSRED